MFYTSWEYLFRKELRLHYYKLVVAYDGTDYAGWQSQGNGTSVAEELVSTFVDVFKLKPSLQGVSRTDAGVHALGQVVWLRTELDLDPERLKFAWSNRLSRAIVIQSIERVSADLRRELKVAEKTYVYHFFTVRPQPFLARYGWYCYDEIDLNKLEQCLQLFVGTHDFRSYCTGDEWEDTVRTINKIDLVALDRPGMYQIIIRGPRFLRYMIRRIVGSCIQVASHSRLRVEYLKEVMLQCDPEQTLRNAPSNGLMLYKIRYVGEPENHEKDINKIF